MNRKPLFDTLRRLFGRGLRQAEVDAIDAALDRSALAVPESKTPQPSWRASERAFRLIRQFEGCARLRPDGLVEAYPDPGTGGHPWTIGWGATGPDIGPGTVWTMAQCDERLCADIDRHAADVEGLLAGSATTQAQFDALTSFHFNTGALGRSTLLKRHRAGDTAAAAAEFARWNRAGGRVLRGLVRRRKAEARLYRSVE